MSGTDVTVEQAGAHVGIVRLNRPPNNYFDTALIVGVAEAYEELDRSGWCRAIVLGSEGRHFCAGLDFAANAGQDIAALYGAALRLFAAPLPVVAAVQGAAIGGGCGLALSADFRVATAQSRFSANFSRLGFHHGFALTVTLPAAVGRQAAADLLLSGRRVRGEQALALGLCDRLAGEDDLLAEAIAYADELAAAGPLAVRSIRATLRSGLVEEARLAMEHEYAEQTRLRDTADFAEGLRAAAGNARSGVPRRVKRGRRPSRTSATPPSPGAEHAGPFRAVTAEQARQYDENGFFVLEDALGAGRGGRPDRGDRSLRGAPGRRVARAGGRALLHCPRRRDHLHHPPGGAVPAAARSSPARRSSPTSAPTSSGPMSASTGTRRSTRSRGPSRRSRGTRTTGTPSWSRSSTSPVGWR